MKQEKLVPELRFSEFQLEWSIARIKNAFSISAGGDIKKKHVSELRNDEFRYPIFANAKSNGGFYAWSDIYKVKSPCITIAGRGAHLGIAIARYEPFYPIVRLLVLKGKKEINPLFFENAFNLLQLFIESTGVPQLTAPQIGSYLVSFPSLPEQQKIADFLTSVDQKIQALTSKVDLLKDYKKGVMQKVFKQEIRFRADDGGEFPDWKEKKNGQIARFVNGKAFKQIELKDSGKFRVLRVGNLFSNNSWYYSDLELPEDKYIDNGDLIYAWSATFGPRFWKEEKVIYHYHIWKVIPNSEVNNNFLYYAFMNDVESIKSQSQGGTMFHITKGSIESRTINLPVIEEQTKIANFLTSIDDKISAVEGKLEKMKEWKKGLLQKMFV